MSKKSNTIVTEVIDFTKLSYNDLVQVAVKNEIPFKGLKKEELRTKLIKALSQEKPVRAPRPGSTSAKILEMWNHGKGCNRYEIAKQLQNYYSFVHDTIKRYEPETLPGYKSETLPVEETATK